MGKKRCACRVELARLQAILDAETGTEGMDGWLFSQTSQSWCADGGRGPGYVERIEAGKWRWTVWRDRERDGAPDDAWTFVPTALEGMEAAMATGRAAAERVANA